jgi:histidine triad (HIT) family protein
VDIPKRKRCPFCDYLAGLRPFTFVRRGNLSSVLVTREQRGLGHVLVVPNAHRETIVDLEGLESQDVMLDVVRSARAIEAVYKPDGIAVWQNNGIAADQAIAHVHFHIAGTFPGRGTERGDVPEIGLEETDQIADLLRGQFD